MKYMCLGFVSGLIFVGLLAAAQNQNQNQNQNAQNKSNQSTAMSDQDFLKEVAQIDLAEIKLGQFARDMAASAAIKKYGERLLTDHTKMNSELAELAKARGVTLPSKTDKKDQELIDQLAKIKGGADFDRVFSKNMVAGHEQAIKIFEAQAKNGQNADVKAWAEKWLPTLKEHLRLARSAAQN